jgi:ribosomal protein L29
MKRNELKSLRTKSGEELEKTLKEKKLELMETRASTSVSKNKNLKQVKIQRRFISQLATILTEKRLAERIVEKDVKEEGKEEESLNKVQSNSKS